MKFYRLSDGTFYDRINTIYINLLNLSFLDKTYLFLRNMEPLILKCILIKGLIYFSETAHCANMYPDTDKDPADLIQAREQIAKLIGMWIA